MRYQFLIDTYATERLKVLSVWSMFEEGDLVDSAHTPRTVGDAACSNKWSTSARARISGSDPCSAIDVGAPPLPETGDPERIRATLCGRLRPSDSTCCGANPDEWWEEAGLVLRGSSQPCLDHGAADRPHRPSSRPADRLLRMLRRDVYSTYGPTADTGGLPANQAPTIYALPDEATLLAGIDERRQESPLPGPGVSPPTERPNR